MGGKAFNDLGEGAFPRIPPNIYNDLKTHLTARLKTLYKLVETPAEAPEKPDHGDLDFTVCEPYGAIAQDDVKNALGARYAIIAEGNRTSNYALPSDCEQEFYQVDVHVCADKSEWERIVFFHGYGDLGMIMGLLARAHGLSLGTKGLKIHSPQADETHPASFHLSSSFDDILPFFGLSMDDWCQGFSTLREIFAWVQKSRFFYPRRMKDPKKREKSRKDRSMYQSFLEFSDELSESGAYEKKAQLDSDDVINEALAYFGKKDEYDTVVKENIVRKARKAKFSGTHVMKWTGLYGHAVKQVMDIVRGKLSDDDFVRLEEDEVRRITLEVQKELCLSA